jgi:hypothetical protein
MYKYFIQLENVVDEGPIAVQQSAYFDTPAQAHAYSLLICFVAEGYKLTMMRRWRNKNGTYKDAEFVCRERN